MTYGRIVFVLLVFSHKKNCVTNILVFGSEESAVNAARYAIRNKAENWGLSPSIADEHDVVDRWLIHTGGEESISIFQSPINEDN